MSIIINALKLFIHNMLQLLWFGKKTITNTLSVYIKTNTGSTLTVDLEPHWDIKNVKQIVAPQLGLQPNEVKIILAGKELSNNTIIAECDLGQQSVLHLAKRVTKVTISDDVLEESLDDSGSKPLCETLRDLSTPEDSIIVDGNAQPKAHFYVYCATCNNLRTGKLRVKCHVCKSGAITVHSDPQSWDDVLLPKRITGTCENSPELCADILKNAEPTFAEFYFKCSEHISLGENDVAVPLSLIRPNLQEVPCLACGDVGNPVIVFPCRGGHVTCLDCFKQYCLTRLRDRQFWQHPEYGYTLQCPVGCPDSFITEVHHFRLLPQAQYEQYHRFSTEEFVLSSGGILCPQPGCGMGILAEPDCTKITCEYGCGYVFCRLCLQGYHIGDCQTIDQNESLNYTNCEFSIDPARAAGACWDEASRVIIKITSKPCPQCRTPTERDGGCMHMVCTRGGCGFHWCWICQTEWTRECMGNHWFG